MSDRAKRPTQANRWRWPLVGVALAIVASTTGCEGPGLEPPYSESGKDAGVPSSGGGGNGSGAGGKGGTGGVAPRAGASAAGAGGAGGAGGAPMTDAGQASPPDAGTEMDGGDDEDAGATH